VEASEVLGMKWNKHKKLKGKLCVKLASKGKLLILW
jgi:hypothetical protein